MGVIYNKEAKEEKLYEAYGMTVYGVANKYRWFIYEDKPDEECITSIRITNGNEELINLGFGNNCIMKISKIQLIIFFIGLIRNIQITMELRR